MRVSTVKKAGVTRISGTTKPAVSSTRVQQVHIHRCLYTQCKSTVQEYVFWRTRSLSSADV